MLYNHIIADEIYVPNTSPKGTVTHKAIGIIINNVINGSKIERKESGECFAINFSIGTINETLNKAGKILLP